MNCATCNTPLEPHARFCPKCGATVNQSPLFQPMARGESPTVPPAQWSPPQSPAPSPWQQPQQASSATPSWQQPQQASSAAPPWQQPQQASSAAPPWQQPQQPGQMVLPAPRGVRAEPLPAPIYKPAAPSKPARKSRLRGFLFYSVTIIVVLLLLLVGAWFLILRPYANSMAQSQLNNALAQAVDNIPSEVALLPSGGTVPISDNTLNLLLSDQSSSSNIVQNANVTITPQNVVFKFQVSLPGFNFPCSVTAVPIASNGKIVLTNVSLSGIIGQVMSADEITTIVNNHLVDAVTRINHSITKVTLKEHEIDLTFGPRGSNGGTPTGTPTAVPTGIPTGIPTAIPTNIPLP